MVIITFCGILLTFFTEKTIVIFFIKFALIPCYWVMGLGFCPERMNSRFWTNIRHIAWSCLEYTMLSGSLVCLPWSWTWRRHLHFLWEETRTLRYISIFVFQDPTSFIKLWHFTVQRIISVLVTRKVNWNDKLLYFSWSFRLDTH